MAFQVILSGHVQGVGCRYYCSRYGTIQGINGSATNLHDGTVRVILETDNRFEAESYEKALVENSAGINFAGRIDSTVLKEWKGPVKGDYSF